MKSISDRRPPAFGRRLRARCARALLFVAVVVGAFGEAESRPPQAPANQPAALAVDADLEAIKKELASSVTLKGAFEQTKKIRVIKKPLASSGDFLLLKDKGVLWRTVKPMESTLRITRDDISEIKNGKAAVLVSMKDQPALGLISRVLFAVFSTDVDELKRHFEFTRAQRPDEAGHWAAALRPRDAMVRKAVERIEIAGGRVVESITLGEVNGDVSVIRFKDVSEIRTPSKDDAALFE